MTKRNQLFQAGLNNAVLNRLYPKPHPDVTRPTQWAEAKLGERFWSLQKDIAQSVVHNRFTAVKGCHGFGKSYIASRIAAQWIDTHPFGEAFLVTSAPTDKQVKAILWREIGRAHAKGNLAGRITLDAEWKIPVLGQDQLVGYGRKPADHDQHGFQGIHELHVLIILDEACGVPKNIWTAMRALMTNDNARALVLGNPDDAQTEFAKCFQPDSQWQQFTVSAHDTPNFTGEPVSPRVKQLLVTRTWVQEAAAEWGIESSLYKSKVLGEFTEVSEDMIFTPQMLRLAHETEIDGSKVAGDYGVDVARFGESETVLYRNQAGHVRLVSARREQAITATTGLVVNEVSAHKGAARAVIDGDGIGGGVVDAAREQGIQVIEFRGGMPARDKKRFPNRRCESYWQARRLIQEGLIDLDPEDHTLTSQLLNIRWSLDSTGRIRVETKDEMRKRGVPSPDRADAFIMSVSPPVEIDITTILEDRSTGITGDLLNAEW